MGKNLLFYAFVIEALNQYSIVISVLFVLVSQLILSSNVCLNELDWLFEEVSAQNVKIILFTKNYQIKPAHCDGDSSNLPLPTLPDSSMKGAIIKIKYKNNGCDVTNPFHQVFKAEVKASCLLDKF